MNPLRFKVGGRVIQAGHGTGTIWSIDPRREAPYLVMFDATGYQDWYEEWELAKGSLFTFRKVSDANLSRVEIEEIRDDEIELVEAEVAMGV